MSVVLKKILASLMILTLASPAFAAGRPGDTNPGHGGGGGGGHGGGGPRPQPTQTSIPTPNPTPTPAPTSTPVGPTQDQIAGARALGMQDGAVGGAREAQERAPREARIDGLHEGRDAGFNRCEHEQRDHARDIGFRDGYTQGQGDGTQAGSIKGQQEGQARGQSEGNSDGLNRADADSARAAAEPGRQKGVEEANASDASSRGATDGSAAGDSEARSSAQATEYPRGHEDYRNERLNEAVQVQDAFSQKAPIQSVKPATQNSFASLFQGSDLLKNVASRLGIMEQRPQDGRGDGHDGNDGEHGRPGGSQNKAKPDYRFSTPNRTFPSQEETQAYRQGYGDGYDRAFGQTYDRAYDRDYREFFQRAEREGCDEANRRDYQGFYQEAYRQGRDKGYSDAYTPAYNSAYRVSYDNSFRSSSDQAYQSSYEGLYQQHFEQARSAAYQAQYQAMYQSSFKSSHDQTYSQVYPGYAQAAYQQGRQDEAADFTQRPVRLLDAEPTETLENGLFEPGEALRLKLSMRNFGSKSLDGRDIKVVLQALDEGSAVISTAQETLVQNLKAKSVTTVSEALEFRMNENAVNQAKQFRVSLFYQNRNVGEKVIGIVTQFQTTLQFVGTPQMKEGIESSFQVKVKNQSSKPTDSSMKVSITSNPDVLEIRKGVATVGVLNPGEERIVEFTAIVRAHGSQVRIPYVLQSLLDSGRRIGLLDGEQSIPLTNDYRIDVSANTHALRGSGVTRIQYTITNASSRLLLKGLQLKARVLGQEAQNFVVIGPNPQYLSPLIRGQSLTFEVPILVKAPNAGGTLELEVQEDGRTVVISQTDF